MDMNDEVERGMNIVIFGVTHLFLSVIVAALTSTPLNYAESGVAGGLSALVALKEILERVRAAGGSIDIDDLCEFIAGAGTGALIACMLGLLRMNIEKAIETYARLVEYVFTDKKMISTSGSGTYKANRLEDELKRIVREATGDENTLMMGKSLNKRPCKVMVFAMSKHNVNGTTPRILRSYQGPNNQMPDCPIWQVIRASMAHPKLFKSFTIGDGAISESLIGGDVGCSNPAKHALIEISAMHPDRYVSSIVCIGAGHARTIQLPKSNPFQRFMPTNVLEMMKDVATDSERVAQEMVAQFEDTPNLYWRFSVDQGLQSVKMSEWQKIGEVVAHARAYIHKTEVKMQMSEAVQAMIERSAVLEARGISGKAQQTSSQRTTLIKRCPAPSPSFTGCERQVSQVSNCLLGLANERRVCVVHGLGGSGKTQIALKAVEQTLDKWADIAYVDATSKETIESTLKGFALTKKIGKTHEDAIRWIEASTQPWLLVLDNADDPDTPLTRYIPGGTRGSVLITTRLPGLAQLGQGPKSDCAVGKMVKSEAVDLLVKKARRQDEDLPNEERYAAEQLVEDLGFLALAMVHAGAYIWCSKVSVVKYRNMCMKNTKIALEKYINLPVNTEEYKKTVYTTWVMSYERLSPRTQQLLWILAYFHPDMIKEDILQHAAGHLAREPNIPTGTIDQAAWTYVKDYLRTFLSPEEVWDSGAFSTVTDELLTYSLIDYDRVNDAYTLHTLVQDWARTVVPHNPLEGLKHASHLLALSISDSSDLEAYAYQRGLVLHVSRIMGASDEVDANDAVYFARVYSESGQWKEEERLLTLVLKEQRHVYGQDHPSILTSMGNLASTYSNQGRWDEAEALQVQVLEVERRVHGEHHPSTLTSMGNLASTYWNQGRWDEAEALQVQVLDAMRRVHGEHHPSTLTSMSNLASTYRKQGRWDETEALQVQVLDAKRRVHGEHHPSTLTSMGNLASTYWNQGRWDEAEALQVQVLDAMGRVHGEHHPSTLTSMGNLASTYRNQGRWDEAEALQVQVLDAMGRVHGEHHPSTLTSMSNLASTYSNQGRWDEAEALQVQVLEVERRVHGEHHPSTLTSMGNLASTYRKQGRWDEAEALQVQVLDAMRRVHGEHHPSTLTSMSNLASTYSNQGRWDEAEALQVQVLEAKRRVHGEHHPSTLTSMSNLASTYWNQGRWDEAEALQVQVLDAMRRVHGEHHPNTLTSMDNLASTYRNQGRWDEAEALQVQVLDAMRRVHGEHHPSTLTSMGNLALTYSNQGRWDEAEALEVQVLEVERRVRGEHHPSTLISMHNLGRTYQRQRKWDEAEILQLQTLAANKRVFGEEHRETLDAMEALANTYRTQGEHQRQELKILEEGIRRAQEALEHK